MGHRRHPLSHRLLAIAVWLTPVQSLAQAEQAPATPSAPSGEGDEAKGAPPQPEASAPTQSVEAQPSTTRPKGLPEDASSWDPPTTTPGKWDWVLLTTGEWLKGTVDAVRDGDMEIDSDQFGDLVIDMDDVAAIYAYRPHIFQLTDRSTLTGVGILRGDELTINGVRLPASWFMGMVDGEPRELNYWKLKLNLSLATRSGNTEQATLSDTLFVRRDAPSNRFTLDTNGSVGSTAGEKNVQTQNGIAQFDWYLSKVFYLTPGLFGFTHDRFQNIDIRAVPATGVGFHAIDTSNVTWDLEVAGGYQYINYRTVSPGDQEVSHDGVARFATRFDADIGEPVELSLSWNSNLVFTDVGRTFHHGQATLELEVTDVLDTTIGVIFDRVERPQREEDGTLPKSNDIQLQFGVQLDLG